VPAFELPNFSIDLKAQTALVTGASSGLGWRFAKVLAACGARVAVTARRVDRLEALVGEIREAGGEARAFALDVSRADAIKGVVDQVEAEMGPVTLLVNNAGVPDAQYATALSLEKIDAVLDTNLKGAFVLSTEVARRLMASKRAGRIVNVASMAAYSYSGGAAALYSISKSALVRMTEVLAVEWAKFDINVNGIAPGVIASEMTTGMLERMSHEMVDAFPRRRIGDPAQLDGALLFLVSPSSDFVTGTVIKVDDGQGAR
jgi:NAD(P)-dependent dehydrogenase (short-subunit alcohol dehydrogenase family)